MCVEYRGPAFWYNTKTLKNFLSEIVEHYDRINAIYHNDIHAGDVMQTSFVVFIQGNLQEKMNVLCYIIY